jgi:sulfur transfer protein SufE
LILIWRGANGAISLIDWMVRFWTMCPKLLAAGHEKENLIHACHYQTFLSGQQLSGRMVFTSPNEAIYVD